MVSFAPLIPCGVGQLRLRRLRSSEGSGALVVARPEGWTVGAEAVAGTARLEGGAFPRATWPPVKGPPVKGPPVKGPALGPAALGGTGAVGPPLPGCVGRAFTTAARFVGAPFRGIAVAAAGGLAIRTAPPGAPIAPGSPITPAAPIALEAGTAGSWTGGAGRAAAGAAEGAVGRSSGGAAARTPVGGAIKTAGGTATGTAIRRLAHGVPGEGGGGSVFSRWSSSSASRLGFRRKSHPSIVSNPVACP